jgi:hypothetical protein
VSAGQRAFGVRRRADMVNGEAAVLQRCGEIIGEPLIVLNELEAHPFPLNFSSRNRVKRLARAPHGNRPVQALIA